MMSAFQNPSRASSSMRKAVDISEGVTSVDHTEYARTTERASSLDTGVEIFHVTLT